MAPLPLCYDVPERRAEDRSLTPIPPDVYSTIFEFLLPSLDLNSEIRCRTIWRNCIPVCKYFRAHFIPLLFSSMTFETNSSGDDLTFKSTSTLCSEIINEEEDSLCFARCVRHCTFVTRVFEDDNYETPYPPAYTRAVRSMPNITSLRLSNSIIDKDMIRTITSLPKLTSLTLAREYGPADGVQEQDLEPLTRLTQISTFRTSIVDNPVMEDVLKRCVCSWSLRSARIETSSLINYFLLHGPTNRLEELYLSRISALHLLSSFLQDLPTLRKLFIRQVNDTSKAGPEDERLVLGPGCIPNLAALRCPPDWALDLVPTRPIQELELTTVTRYDGFQHTKDLALWSCLRKATRPITRVRFRLETYQAHILMMEFPSGWFSTLLLVDVWRHVGERPKGVLSYRSLRTAEDRQSMETSFTILFNDLMGPASSLVTQLEVQDLIRDRDSLDLVFQHHILVDMVVAAFPDVTAVKISDWIEWRKDGQGEWWPFLYQRTAVTTGQTIHSFLKRVRDQVESKVLKDWRGFFRSVLPRTHPRWDYLQTRLDKLSPSSEDEIYLNIPLPESPDVVPCDFPSPDAHVGESADANPNYSADIDREPCKLFKFDRAVDIPLQPSPLPSPLPGLPQPLNSAIASCEVEQTEPRIERAREDRKSDADRRRWKEHPTEDGTPTASNIMVDPKSALPTCQFGSAHGHIDPEILRGELSETSFPGLLFMPMAEPDTAIATFSHSTERSSFGPLSRSEANAGPHDAGIKLSSSLAEKTVLPLDAHTTLMTEDPNQSGFNAVPPPDSASEEVEDQHPDEPWLVGSAYPG